MGTGRWLSGLLVLPMVVACGSGPEPAPTPEPTPTPTPTPAPAPVPAPPATPGATVTVEVADRPVALHIPESYAADEPAPLVVVLHGYTSSGAEQERYFQLTPEADRRGFLYAMPDGTTDPSGDRFWNATEACCDFHDTGVDDSTYLRQLIDTVTANYQVDPARVYLVGHSNGGFMAHRMACDHADVITAVVSLAGAARQDASECNPQRAVSVLQIHGTADDVIPYDGGANFGRPFPSATETVQQWRERNGCTDEADSPAAPLDLDAGVPGAETTVTQYRTGCDSGSRAVLWTIDEGSHVPPLNDTFASSVIDFLYEHSSG